MDLQASSSLERRFRSEEREGRQAHRTTVGRKDNWTTIEEAVQVVEATRSGGLHKLVCRAVHVHKYRTKEGTAFVALECSSISMNRTAEARKTPRIKM